MIEIRELEYNDVIKYKEELLDYLQMNLCENYPEYDSDMLIYDFYEKMKKYSLDKSAILLGAFDDEKLVGFHWAHETLFLGKRRLHSYMNGIAHEYRGMHIGSRFFGKLEELAKQYGINEIEALCRKANDAAVNYHLHNGFEIEAHKVVKKI